MMGNFNKSSVLEDEELDLQRLEIRDAYTIERLAYLKKEIKTHNKIHRALEDEFVNCPTTKF